MIQFLFGRKKIMLIVCFVTIVAYSSLAQQQTNGNFSKPNILFIFTDDQRFGTISGLGNNEIKTPNLDRLVKKGITFTNAHIMGGTSPAVCMPSRAMMLTGRTLFSIEEQGEQIPEEHVALPEWFKKNGYTTAHVGKWHQDRATFKRSYSTGAKIFGFANSNWMQTNGHWHIPVHDFDPTGVYAPERVYNDPPYKPFVASSGRDVETTKEDGRHSVDVFSDAAIDFIRNYPKTEEGKAGKPFYLYLAQVAPHDPRQYPARFKKQYNAKNVSLPENFATEHPFDNGELYIRDEMLEQHPRRPEEVKQHIADYYALIAYIDERLGDVFQALKESGQADNTIIIFSADNGLAIGQHGLMGKQNLYDCSVHVPLVVAGPGIPENKKTDALCYLIDIFPTLCDLTTLPIPHTVEGKSLAPIIAGETTGVRNTLFFAYCGVQRAVCNGDYKLIEYVVKGEKHTQLFDMKKDPFEMNNIATESQNKEELIFLQGEIRKWQTELGDTTEMGRQFWNRY